MTEPNPGATLARRPLLRLDQLLEFGAPDRPALTFRSETLSYAELGHQVAAAAAGLRDLGIQRGDRVVVYAEKRIETVIAMLAVSAADAVLVPVNPLFKARQVGYVVNDCAARAVVTTTERAETVREALLDSGSVGNGPVGNGPVDNVVLIGGGDIELPATDGFKQVPWSEVSGHAPRSASRRVIDTDVAAIFYTSGSTGGPKGVVLSHRNLLAGAESVAGYLGHTEQDVVLSVLPLSFDAGFSQLSTSLLAGAHLVLCNYLMPREVLRLCAKHRVTALTCVPPLWLQLAALDWPAESSERLRYFANTGGRMPGATLDRLRQLFPKAKPYLMYGLTEAFRSTYLDPAETAARPGSIGKAIPNAEILILRPDGTECAAGEHGELVHRGALVALGYWNDPERTAQRFRPVPGPSGLTRPELAVWSGDTAYRDEQGFLYFVGRVDDMIKTSGFRVSPTEIEEAAYATGMITGAAAFGIGDERLGQHIVLVVSGNPEVGPCDPDLLDKALANGLPKYMLPQRTIILDELPRSVNGKFDRVELRRIVESG